MERVTLQAEVRHEKGKGAARALRRQGYIPAVLYRGGHSTPIKLNKHDLVRFINSTMGQNVMINLQFQDGTSRLALLKDYQVDPIKGELLHTDFYEVSLKEKVRVSVAVVLQGEPVGVKKEGGILEHGITELEIECLPEDIPPHIEVDVSGLHAGDSLHVEEIRVPDNIRVLSDPKEVIATVVVPLIEEAPAEEEEEEVEPEVLKKGKKEEEEVTEE